MVQGQGICTVGTDFSSGDVILEFPSVEFACPEVGVVETWSVEFYLPTSNVATSDAGTATQVSISISHGEDGIYDNTDGLDVASGYYGDWCDALPDADNVYDDFLGPETSNLLCNGDLVAFDKLCAGISYNGDAGSIGHYGIVFTNNGGCFGNVLIEANLRDFNQNDDGFELSECLEGPYEDCVEYSTTDDGEVVVVIVGDDDKVKAIAGDDDALEPEEASGAAGVVQGGRGTLFLVVLGLLATVMI